MKFVNSSRERYLFQKASRRLRDSEPNIFEVIPFGPSGFGLWTEHPVGAIIGLGLLVMVVAGIPEAGWFFAGVALLGGFCGFLLWLHHRSSGTI